jgi:hypothetical protein
VAEVGGGPALGAYTGRLAQLERGLERNAHQVSPSDACELVGVLKLHRRALRGRRVVQELHHQPWQALPVAGLKLHRAERLRDQRHRRQLRRERLGGRDGALLARAERDVHGGPTRERAVGLVRHRDRPRAGLAKALEDGRDLRSPPRLADSDREPALDTGLHPVERLEARCRERDGEARGRLQQVAAEDRSVVRGSARDDHDSGRRRPRHRLDDLVAPCAQRSQHCRLLSHVLLHQAAAHGKSTSGRVCRSSTS